MLSQSDKTIAAWKATERTLAARVTIAGREYTATDINSLKYDAGAYTGETFAIGSTYSNNVQIEFSHLVEGLKLGDVVEVSIGIKVSNEYIYESLGVFIISSEIKMDRNNNLTTISASDQFCKLEGIYKSKLKYPANILDIVREIGSLGGVNINVEELSRLPDLGKLSNPIEGQSYRKSLGWIAQLYAGYATFDRTGQLTIRTVSEPNYELDPNQYEQGGLTKNEATYKISGIQCQVTTKSTTRDDQAQETTTTLQVGSTSGAQIKLENNIMTQARLDDVWQKLKDINFYPFSLNWFGNPAVEAGDWLRLYDKKGNDFVVPNNSYTLEFNGGLSAVSKADQTSGSSQVVSWTGGVMQTIKELQHRNAPDGTVIFPTSVTEPPKNAHFNDVWFKKNGNSTELWIFERQSDGTGKWQRKDVANDAVKKQIEDQQKGLEEARTTANMLIDKSNLVYEQAVKGLAEAKETAEEAKRNTEEAKETAEEAKRNTAEAKETAEEARRNTAEAKKNVEEARKEVEVVRNSNANAISALNTSVKNAVDTANNVSKNYSSLREELLNSDKNNYNLLLAEVNKTKQPIAELKTGLEGVNGKYASLDGRVGQFSAGLDGLTVQFNTSKEQLTQLKADAKGLHSSLSDANGNLTRLQAKANSIEQQMLAKVDNNLFESFKSSTAKELKEKLTVTDLNGYVKTAELIRTADGIRTSITAVEGKIENLNIGGRNYLQGTADFTWPNDIGTWNDPKKSIENYNDSLKMLHVSNAALGGIYTRWSGAFPNGELQVGEEYTLSFDAKGRGTFLAVGNESGNQATKSSLVNTSLTSTWKRYSVSGTIATLNKAFVVYFKDNYDAYIKCVKIEKGNRASDWSPAPEDAKKQFTAVNNTLKAYKTDLDILKDGMSVRVSEIAQVNNKITDLSIGGTNLLSNTSVEAKSNDAPTSNWVEGAVYNTINPLTESKYVLSFEARGDVDRQTIGTFLWSGGLGGGNIARSSVSSDGHTSTSGDGQTFVTLSTTWKKYWVKYEVAPDNTRKSAIVGRRWSDSKPSGKVYIRKVKLETGDKATDYSPAPEDLESKYASLNIKVDGINTTVANKADTSYVNQEANKIKSSVLSKADISYVDQEANKIKSLVSSKADTSYVNQEANKIKSSVSSKADTSYVDQEANKIKTVVSSKADTTYVDQEVNKIKTVVSSKADTSYVDQEANKIKTVVSSKAYTSYVDQEANKIKSVVSSKASTTYVDQKVDEIKNVVSSKAGTSYVNQEATRIRSLVSSKADTTYVDQKVSQINSVVANKADVALVTQTANSWQTKLDGLRIGGTNLLANTSQEQHRVISPTGNATYSEGAVYVTTQPLNDTKYTLSFEAKADRANQYIESYFYNHGLGGANGVMKSVDSNGETKVANKGDGNFKVNLTTNWKRYWITYDFVPDNTKKGVIVGRRFKFSNPTGDVFVRKVKLEIGDKATDYSPAPEDTVVAISAVRTDLTNAINLRVSKGDVLSQLNIEAGHTLIQSKKIYLDADSVVFSGKAFIPNAAIANLSADKINGGTINGRTINVTNLNANNITSGTINGQNLSINLDNGIVNFQKGKLHNFNRTVDIDLDDSYISTADQAGRIMFKGGSIQIVQPNIFDKSSDPYLEISNYVGSGSFHGGVIKGRDNVVITNSANSLGYSLAGGLGQSTFAGLFVGQSDYAGWQPTVIGGADRGVYIVGGKKMPSSNNIFTDHSRPLITGSPFIHVGTNPNGVGSWGDRIYIEGDYVHIPSAYRKTSGGSGNVIVAPDGALVRAVSALKYKKDIIRTYVDDYGEKLLQLPTATWLDKNEVESSMNAQRHFGMIAEDFADNDLDIFVTRDANGEVEGLQYDRIAPALIPVIRNLKTKVDNLYKIAKNPIINTSQGKTAINAYETAEYYFGDISKTNTGPTKRVKIMIDPLFLETINTEIDYHVFLSSYDNGYAWVSEMAKDYFVIESNVPNLPVSYEIKAKRKQYENVRLDKVDVNLTGGTN